MKWKFVLPVLVMLFGLALASGNYSKYLGSPWYATSGPFVSGHANFSMEYNETYGPVFVAKTNESYIGAWRLWKVIPHPPANDFYVSFKVWIHAPGIDLDRGNARGYTPGEAEDNDGPNIFAFLYYGNGETNVSHPGFNPTSPTWPPSDGDFCHIHIECNYYGEDERVIYCMSPDGAVYKGRLFDGYSLSDPDAVNKLTEEPITQDEWHTVVMKIDRGKCLHDNLSLVIMGSDVFFDKSFTWKIADVEIYDENQTFRYKLPLDSVQVTDNNNNKTLKAPAYCGNGIKESPNALGQYEECDGNDGIKPGFKCTEDCKLVPICGDNRRVDGEVCDGTDTPKGFRCSPDCKSMSPVCGDGIVVDGELCDGENVTKGFKCSPDCKSMEPICGDGIVAGLEECDDNASVKPGWICVNCHLVRDLGPGTRLVKEVLDKEVPAGESEIIEFKSDKPFTLDQGSLDQYLSAIGSKKSVKICLAGICEDEYVHSGKLVISPGSNFVKIYNKNGTYYVGSKLEKSSIDMGIVLIIAVLVLLVAIIIIGILAFYFLYWKKRERIKLGRVHKKRRKILRR